MLTITPGDSAAAALVSAGVADRVLPWHDLLHEGPVPAGLAVRDLALVRAAYAVEMGWAPAAEAQEKTAGRDAAFDAAARRTGEICLWFDANLVSQLALLQVLDRLALLRPAAHDVTLTGPHTFGGTSSDELRRLWTQRRAVTAAQLAYARGAWAALCSSDPTTLLPYAAPAAAADAPLAALGAAIRRHLQQFPWVGDGLGLAQRRALAAVAAGHSGFTAIFAEVCGQDDPPFLADSVLRSYLEDMGAGEHPLLYPLPDGGYAITADGAAALDGSARSASRLRSDRWIGGAQLDAAASWRWDPDRNLLLN